MLAEKDFRNKVWEKYDNYMLGNNRDSFYEKRLYSEPKFINIYEIVRAIATFILTAIVGAGVVYAATVVYERIWEKPEVIEYHEEQQITEEDKENLITEEQAKNNTLVFLKRIEKADEIVKTEYIKYPAMNKIYWKITTNIGYEIEINAQNGKVVSYFDKTVNDVNIKAIANQDQATDVATKLYNLISKDSDYELKAIIKLSISDDSCLWQADYCKKYDNIFNDYQCIRITFVPETEQIKIVNIFDEDFENNPIVITKEEAENIVKEKLNNEKIISMDTILKIEKMNEYVYMQDNNLKGDQAYKMDVVIRKVWSVECNLEKNNHQEVNKFYVDVTTGEIIGGDSIK